MPHARVKSSCSKASANNNPAVIQHMGGHKRSCASNNGAHSNARKPTYSTRGCCQAQRHNSYTPPAEIICSPSLLAASWHKPKKVEINKWMFNMWLRQSEDTCLAYRERDCCVTIAYTCSTPSARLPRPSAAAELCQRSAAQACNFVCVNW